MTRFEPQIIRLTGFGVKQAAREVLEALEASPGTRDNASKIAFLRYALRSVEGWEVGNWYRSRYWDEDYLVTDIKIDLYREAWSVTVANTRELLTGQYRTHCTPWNRREDPTLPVDLTKSYDWQDQCVTHNVVHLVLQNPTDHLCCTIREEMSWGAQEARPQMDEKLGHCAGIGDAEEYAVEPELTLYSFPVPDWDNSDAAWLARMF